MKTIALTQGQIAVVDDADFVYLAGFRWHAQIKLNGKKIHLGSFMSRESAAHARVAAGERYFGEFSGLK